MRQTTVQLSVRRWEGSWQAVECVVCVCGSDLSPRLRSTWGGKIPERGSDMWKVVRKGES